MPALDYIIREREARAMRQAELRRPYRSAQSFSIGETLTASELNDVTSQDSVAYNMSSIGYYPHPEAREKKQQQSVEERAVIIFETLKRAAAIGGGQKGELDPDSLVRLTADLISRLSPVFEEEDKKKEKEKGTLLSVYVAPGESYQTTVGSYHNTGAIPVQVIVQEA